MVILNENKAGVAVHFFQNRIGKFFVHPPVGLPIRLAKDRLGVGDVAERPERLVGKTVVVPLFLLWGKPDPPQGVNVFSGRNRHSPPLIHRLPVRISRPMRHPGAAAGLQNRVYGHGHAGNRPFANDSVRSKAVDVRLPVGNHDEFVLPNLGANRLLQGCTIPYHTSSIFFPSTLSLLAFVRPAFSWRKPANLPARLAGWCPLLVKKAAGRLFQI